MPEHLNTRIPGRASAIWPGYVGAALVLFALLRASIDEGWDLWCTLSAAAGVAGIGVWSLSNRAMLGRGARTRSARFGGQTLVSSALLLGVLVLVNFLAERHNGQLDLTE